jgi:hypothetical protein
LNILDLIKLDETPTRLDRMGDSFMEDKDSLTPEESLELFSDLIQTKEADVIDHVNRKTQFMPETYFKKREQSEGE